MSKLILTEQSAAPTAPAASSGKWLVYAKTTGKLWAMDDTGFEYDLTAGAAGGEDLAETLAIDNTTGGTDIVLSDGDVLRGESGAGVAGNVTLLGGTSSASGTVTDGGSIVIIPGATTPGGDDGGLVLTAATGSNSVVFKTIGDEVLSIGTTFPFEYDGTTGKLTIPGIIDPVAIVFEEADAPATTGTEGAVFVSDGTGGLTAGHLYYVPPSSGVPIDISNPAATADTLQSAYDAGNSIALSDLTAIEVTAGDNGGTYPKPLIQLSKYLGSDLLAFKQQDVAVTRFEGAQGAAGIAGTTLEMVAGSGAGGGNNDGGLLVLQPGPAAGAGDDGTVVIRDVSGTNEVAVAVDKTATYPAPVLLSEAGTFGVTLGPVVSALDSYTATTAGADVHVIPNNASVCLYNNGVEAGTRAIYLPAAPVPGQTVVVKDSVGTALARPATIYPSAGNIDGGASVPLNANWKAYTFVFNQNWYVI